MALVAVMSMDPQTFFETGKNQPMAFATGIASFAAALGMNETYAKIFISLAISAFMMTSLDTATRLGRFLWQEIFLPRSNVKEDEEDNKKETPQVMPQWRKFITNVAVASFAIVGLSMVMAMSGSASSIWPIFGASNQLMSALTFLAITLYLLMKGSRWYIAFIPMIFMMVMSLWGVIQVVNQQWDKNLVFVTAGIFLIAMALLMVALGVSIISTQLKKYLKEQRAKTLIN